jgi:hypothetical protein
MPPVISSEVFMPACRWAKRGGTIAHAQQADLETSSPNRTLSRPISMPIGWDSSSWPIGAAASVRSSEWEDARVRIASRLDVSGLTHLFGGEQALAE